MIMNTIYIIICYTLFVPGQERSAADERMIYILYMYDLLLVFVYERNSELVGHYAFVQI